MPELMKTLMRVGIAAAIGWLVGNYGKAITNQITSRLPSQLQPYGGTVTGLLLGAAIDYLARDMLGEYADVVAAAVAAGFAADPPETTINQTATRAISPEIYTFGGVIR